MGSTAVGWLWLIPAFPAAGALLNATLGRAAGRSGWVSAIGTGAIVAAFGLSALTLGGPRLTQHLWQVAESGGLRLEVGLAADPLASVMLLLITGVAALIHVSAAGSGWRCFAGLNLFVAAMGVLVLADNLVLMFVGWEGVAFCSWLLIGHRYDEHEHGRAANRAFLVNRVGDAGLVVGMLMVFASSAVAPTFDFEQLQARFLLHAAQGGGAPHWLTPACLLIFAGAVAKSAQLPLHGWLPDAMVGPTPASALIHAATVVTAGIYLLVRLSFLFAMSPVAIAVVACVGAATAVYAASCAIVQTDFKRVLAYSTSSQLGLMFLAVGLGARWTAVFHLVAHAFAKACLVLGAGAVLRQTHQADLRHLGGLRATQPQVAATYAFAALALGAVPVLGSAAIPPGPLGAALWAVGAVASLGTGVYAWRSVTLAFGGEWRGPHDLPAGRTPRAVRWALIALAVGALGLAGLALPVVARWFDPAAKGGDPLAAGVALAAFVLGAWLAGRLWAKGPRTVHAPRLAAFFVSGWGFDGAYRRVVRGAVGASARLAAFDRIAVDGLVQAFAAIVRYLCIVEAALDAFVVDGTVHLVGELSLRTGRGLRRLQSGDLMRYLYVAVAGALLVLCLQYWIR